jgi:DNA-directed RNA polymerase subunit F
MARYNVNVARAQRLEALGEAWEFEVDEEMFSLPTELPRDAVGKLAGLEPSDLDGLLTVLLGEEQLKRLDQHTLSVQDIQAVLEAYGRDTGMALGESSASTRS